MNSVGHKSTSQPALIEFLVFSVGGIRFGADMEQVSKISRREDENRAGQKIFNFHEMINFKKIDCSYKSPKAILLKDCNEEIGILVDSPEGIISRTARDIQPIPSSIKLKKGSRAIWGATVIEDDIILLVDLLKLCNN